MLIDILKVMAQKPILTTHELAREVDIPLDVLDDMLRLLEEMGYIKSDQSCDTEIACSSCSVVSECSMANTTGHGYRLTERGMRFVREREGS